MVDTVYLAGPIKRDPDYVARFAAAVVLVREKWPQSRIFNPAELPPGKSNAWYMARCCRMVCMSDMVYLLPGFEKSGGAQVEIALARYCDIPIKHVSELSRSILYDRYGCGVLEQMLGAVDDNIGNVNYKEVGYDGG